MPLNASPSLAIIIPALNEADGIVPCLQALQALRARGVEVVLVDGGSTDDTLALARKVNGVTVLQSPRGRAQQMNRGAAHAQGDVLLFLHADTTLPPDAHACIQTALADPGVREQLRGLNTDARSSTPEQTAALLASDIRRWRSVIERAGIQKQ